MAYCTLTDIQARLEEDILLRLTDDAGAGAVDEAIVAQAIADADAEIDGYVGGRYTTPLSPVPGLILRCSREMSIYMLHSRRGGAPEEWRDRYGDCVRLLRAISRGEVALGLASGEGAPASGGVEIVSNPRLMSRDGLGDW